MTSPGNYVPINASITNGASGNTSNNNYANAGGNGVCSYAGNWPVNGGGGGGAGGGGGTTGPIFQKVADATGQTYNVTFFQIIRD